MHLITTLYLSGAYVKMVGVGNTVTSKKRPSVKMAWTMIIVSQFLMKLLAILEVNYISSIDITIKISSPSKSL